MKKSSLKNYTKTNLTILIFLMIFGLIFLSFLTVGIYQSAILHEHKEDIQTLVSQKSDSLESFIDHLVVNEDYSLDEAINIAVNSSETRFNNGGEFIFVRNTLSGPVFIRDSDFYEHRKFYSSSVYYENPLGMITRKESGVSRGTSTGDDDLLAAYTYVESKNLGVIAIVDLDKYNQTYNNSNLIIVFVGLVTVFYLSIFFFKMRINILRVIDSERRSQIKTNRQLLTELRQNNETENQLKYSREKLERVIRMTPIPMVVVSFNKQVEILNFKFTENFGYKEKDTEDSYEILTELFPNEIYRQYAYESLFELEVGSFSMNTWDVTTKDGHIRECEIYVVVTNDAHIIMLNDITEENKLKNELVKSKEAAEELSEVKSNFLSTMSHEIRTPINGVLGMAELLYSSNLDKDQKKYVKAIKSSGTILLGLINDLLDISKIEANKLVLDRQNFNLKVLVNDLIELESYKTKKKNVALVLDFSSSVPKNFIGDPGRIRQILLNLIDNAFKFTKEGEIVVKISLLSETSDFSTIEFSVEDNGIGISSNRINTVFEKFTQEDVSTTREYGGTGLGLAICKELVEAMGGSIRVQSKQGEGSTFSFFIELQKQKDNIVESRNNCSTTNILIVDDNKINQKVAKGLLDKEGYPVEVVSSGKEALKILSEKEFSIVLMDCNMPEMDGYQTTEAIRSGSSSVLNRDVKIIAMTANDSEDDKKRCFKSGMNEFIAKPIDPSLLFSTIERNIS